MTGDDIVFLIGVVWSGVSVAYFAGVAYRWLFKDKSKNDSTTPLK